jgi:diguanylate cyclase (GGDEF)-like protein
MQNFEIVNIFSAMNMVIMKHEKEELFTLSGECPIWFKSFFASDIKTGDIVKPAEIFPFLADFIDNSACLINGQSKLEKTSNSIWWTEIEKHGEVHYLQAVLTSSGKNTYLIIKHASGDSELVGSIRKYRAAMIEHESRLEGRNNAEDNSEVVPDLLLKDGITGLHNKRAFLLLAKQQHNMAKRNKVATLIIMLDCVGLEAITKKFGEDEAVSALSTAADILKNTFRGTDVIGRLDEDGLFVVLALEIAQNGEKAIIARLRNKIENHNRMSFKTYDLNFIPGIVSYGFDHPGSMEELLQIAGFRLNENRVARKIL